MSAVCLDTHIVIWGVQRKAKPQQRGMIERTRLFLQHLSDRRVTVVMPSIVVAELLVGIPVERHEAFYRLVEARFMVPPFDTLSASYFARIWQEKRDHPDIKKILEDGETTKNILKADCMLVATALAIGASRIYSHDPHIRNFAGQHIMVSEIPEMHVQDNWVKDDPALPT